MKKEKNNQTNKENEECPLCQVSEETLKQLRKKSLDQESQEKPAQKKKGLCQKLFKDTKSR